MNGVKIGSIDLPEHQLVQMLTGLKPVLGH